MDIARNKNTLEHIDAEALWHIQAVDQDGYICIGCRLKATPCSYDRKVNKKRPYFRFDEPDMHEKGCFFEQDEKLTKEAKKKKISTPEGFPLSHPSILILGEERSISDPQGTGSTGNSSRTISKGSGGPSETQRKHNYSVKTINSIAKHYLNFPYDRRSMPLSISDVSGGNYNEVIKQLPDEIVLFQENKLRFGRLNNFTKPIVDDSTIVIKLLSGCWLNNKPSNTYDVVINTSGWSDSKKGYILSLVSASQDEYKENKRKGTFVFFIGKQCNKKANEFIIDDYRLFTCLSH